MRFCGDPVIFPLDFSQLVQDTPSRVHRARQGKSLGMHGGRPIFVA